MSQLLCRLCFLKKMEYFTVNTDFCCKIIKHLDVQINENVLICKTCIDQLESFAQFYEEIHKIQEKYKDQQTLEQSQIQQKNEIRYIILLKDKQEYQVKQNDAPTLSEQNYSLVDISSGTHQPIQERLRQKTSIIQGSIQGIENSETHEEKELDNASDQSREESEVPLGTANTRNLHNFPKEFIKNTKFLIKGKKLLKLIAKFYSLDCNLCEPQKKFKKYSALMSHFKKDHSIKGYVTCCEQKLVKLRQVSLHMARHIQPEAFQCPKCKKLLTCPKILQYHIQNHLPEHKRILACPEPGCDRRFSYQSALTTHSVSHLPEDVKTSFPCETCGRKFKTSGRLTVHNKMIHSKDVSERKEFICGICAKKFNCKSNLSYHLTTHQNFEFQVSCQICNKWLKNKICLRKHMTIHSEVKHFCDICDYSAANKQCLMNHKKVQHSDDKPFTCEVCSKTFKLKNTLVNHVNAQHSGLRKYSCEFCSKTFVSSGNYYAHRKRMHPQQLQQKIHEKELNEQNQRIEAGRQNPFS